jgi:hypothetical protein
MNARRHSPVLDLYAHPTERGEYFDMSVAVGGQDIDPARLALIDISPVPKRLVAGVGAAGWLMQHCGEVPKDLFDCADAGAGGTVVRLHYTQYLIVGGLDGECLRTALTADDSATDGVLLLPYECAEFALLGADLDPLFNELSACNPALLQADRWLATRFAHAEVGLRLITVPQPHLRVVCSPADARFLFELLSTLVAEHGGLTTTLDAYIRLIGVMR